MPLRLCSLFLVALLLCSFAAAQTITVYNSISKPLPGNVFSEGPEAYAFAELGDGFQLTANTGTLGQVTVVLSSWACQSGNWYSGNCVTASGATFSVPITINVYSVNDLVLPPAPAAQIATITQTFSIPYRPTSTPQQCNGDASRWYSSKEKTCYHGLAVPIVVNFSTYHVPVPPNGKLIVTVAYNSTHYGPHPIGELASCFGTSAGCPYDSLNISTDTTNGTFQLVGQPLDLYSIFVNYTLPNTACSPGTTVTGVLAMDAGCWTGQHPQIQVMANTNATGKYRGNGL